MFEADPRQFRSLSDYLAQRLLEIVMREGRAKEIAKQQAAAAQRAYRKVAG